MGHLHSDAGGPEAVRQEPFLSAGGLTHSLCSPRTVHVLQPAAKARTAVSEAVHGTFRHGYVLHGLGHIGTRYHHVPTSLRTIPVSLSSLLVDASLTPWYLFGVTSIVREMPHGVAVPCRSSLCRTQLPTGFLSPTPQMP